MPVDRVPSRRSFSRRWPRLGPVLAAAALAASGPAAAQDPLLTTLGSRQEMGAWSMVKLPPEADRMQAVHAAGVMAAVAGMCMAIAFASWIFALMHTTVANALFLLTTQPFLTAILARVILGERVHRTTWLTMSLALVGVGVMVRESLTLGTLFGNLIALGAALGLSGFTIALRKGKDLDMFPATWWAGSFASLLAAGSLRPTSFR